MLIFEGILVAATRRQLPNLSWSRRFLHRFFKSIRLW